MCVCVCVRERERERERESVHTKRGLASKTKIMVNEIQSNSLKNLYSFGEKFLKILLSKVEAVP